jgi:hypothetical protein
MQGDQERGKEEEEMKILGSNLLPAPELLRSLVFELQPFCQNFILFFTNTKAYVIFIYCQDLPSGCCYRVPGIHISAAVLGS